MQLFTVYLQLSGVAQLCAAISWFVSTMCRRVKEGADLPPAKARHYENYHRSIPVCSTQISFVCCRQTNGFIVFAHFALCVRRKCHAWVLCLWILPFACRPRRLRETVCWPPGRRLAAPPPSRSVGAGLLDLEKYKGAEVWLRRFLPRPSLSIILDLAFLLIVLGVGNRLPISWGGR